MSDFKKQTPEEILTIMVNEANEGIKKYGAIDQGDRKKILSDGYMDVQLKANLDREDPRIRMLLFQYFEGMRAKLALAPTHITWSRNGDEIVFRYHVLPESTAPVKDIFKKAIMKLECAREGRHAELTKQEYDAVFAFYLPSLNDKAGTWHGKPYIVLPDTNKA